MAFRVPKRYLYQVLFALCVAVPYLNSYELTFGVWSIAALICLRRSYSRSFLFHAGTFAVILAIAFVVFLFKKYETYYVIRDITYMAKPILGLMIGYEVCRRNFEMALKTVIVSGLLIAIVHLSVMGFAIVVHHASTLNDLRFYGGYFSDYEVYAFILLLFHKEFGITWSRQRIRLFLLIIGVSWIAYFARTNFIQFVILYVAMKGYFKITRKSIIVVSSMVALVLIGYSVILYINPKRNGAGIEALLYKIKIAPTEPFKTKINPNDWRDFNDNYRSYENIHTVRQMVGAGPRAVITGEGLGSKVDLKRRVFLGDMQLRYISILHNGYMTVFLKSGLLGVFIYLFWIYRLTRRKESDIPIVKSMNLLFVGTGIFMILSSWVFLGLYNLLDTKSILIGLMIAHTEMARRKALAERTADE